MRRREFIALAGSTAVAWPLTARAQQPQRMRLVGVLLSSVEGDPAGESRFASLRNGLAKLGWTQSNLQMEVRWVSSPTLIERHAAELITLDADVLVGESTAALRAFQQQTKTIPIIFLGVADPIGQGFVTSLAHPGANITGFSGFDAPMAGKLVGMLTQIIPPVARVAVLFHPATAPYGSLMLHACEEAARPMALAVRAAPVNDESEIETVIVGIAQERSGVLVVPSAFTVAHHDVIVATINSHRVPAIYELPIYTRDGGLIAYGPDLNDLFRRAADYVDRILKGDKPGDLPVQEPTKFELIINLRTAKTLGITISPTLLATADEVIE